MAVTPRGLGRGLDALLKGYDASQASKDGPDVRTIPIRAIVPNPNQPRKEFTEASLAELAESIRSQGVLQPILVRSVRTDDGQRFEIVAGERRWRASQLAGLKEMPALVRDLSDEESLAIALIENLQREDLNPIEEALGLKELQQRFGLNQETLAKRIGKSRPAVANTMRLLQLPESAQDDIRNGHMSAGHARALLVVADPAAQQELRRRIVEQGLSVRESEAQAAQWKEQGTLPELSATAPAERRSRASRSAESAPATPETADVRERLTEVLGLPVALRGTLSKGSLVLTYKNREQLQGLIELLEGRA
ncbi:MAG: ParB/RepB/Spo0J family partition protein [Desulfovibrionaceae bacterium]|jgi:ParB family chromosome partitioning protein|nr:ParB/RepB/Spo0J family partition protein [Desulfovibrionaceae bacterium]